MSVYLSVSLSLSLVTGETAYQPIITGECFFFKLFLIQYYKYDCNTACHKITVTVDSLVYRLGYHKNHIAASSLSMHESFYL